MLEDVLPGFTQSVLAERTEFRQVLLKDVLSFEGRLRVECVADVTAGAWLDALPVASVAWVMGMLCRLFSACLGYVQL